MVSVHVTDNLEGPACSRVRPRARLQATLYNLRDLAHLPFISGHAPVFVCVCAHVRLRERGQVEGLTDRDERR